MNGDVGTFGTVNMSTVIDISSYVGVGRDALGVGVTTQKVK